MNYKLIAIDMDGTLLKSDKSVHPDTISDIKKATDNGMDIVFCTGRSVSQLNQYFKIFPMIRYAICCSGAVIYDNFDKRIICKSEIERKYVKKAMDVVANYRAMADLLMENESIISKKDLLELEAFGMEVYRPLFSKIARKVDDIQKEAKKYDFIPKINTSYRSNEDKLKAYEELKNLPLELTFGRTSGIEITARGVTKAKGLDKLLHSLGLSSSEAVGIGDADNDRELLKSVGFSVAMGNATDEIKKIAKYMTDDNNHNGVGKAIQYIIENE